LDFIETKNTFSLKTAEENYQIVTFWKKIFAHQVSSRGLEAGYMKNSNNSLLRRQSTWFITYKISGHLTREEYEKHKPIKRYPTPFVTREMQIKIKMGPHI
jgi:hypothetical protein